MRDSASRSAKRESSRARGPSIVAAPAVVHVVRAAVGSASTKSAWPVIVPIAPSTRPPGPPARARRHRPGGRGCGSCRRRRAGGARSAPRTRRARPAPRPRSRGSPPSARAGRGWRRRPRSRGAANGGCRGCSSGASRDGAIGRRRRSRRSPRSQVSAPRRGRGARHRDLGGVGIARARRRRRSPRGRRSARSRSGARGAGPLAADLAQRVDDAHELGEQEVAGRLADGVVEGDVQGAEPVRVVDAPRSSARRPRRLRELVRRDPRRRPAGRCRSPRPAGSR